MVELPSQYYTRVGQRRIRQFVSTSGGILNAAVKLDVPSFFIKQILIDGPVPDHLLNKIELQVGPIRLMEPAPNLISNTSPQKPTPIAIPKLFPDPELTLEEFVRNCGGPLAASLKLGVSTSTLQKIRSGISVSASTVKKIYTALNAIGCSIASESSDSPLNNLALSSEMPASHESSSHQRGVYPSTVRKVQEGLPVSRATQRKLGISHDDGRAQPTCESSRTNPAIAIAKRLREIIKSDIDLVDLASKWGITETSIRKLYESRSVTRAVLKKVEGALGSSEQVDPLATPSVAVDRLRTIHNLYERFGTLDAVGKHLGLTRERVRQLLAKGKKIGLFEYNPRGYPFVSREKILEDYKHAPNVFTVARLNNISTGYLRKLFTAYSITEEELSECSLEGKRAKCIEQYHHLVVKAGHHLTTTELQTTSEGHALHSRIIRLWGTIDAFREAINIPKPPKGSPSFRKDTEQWREHRRQIALVARMQQLDQIREYLDSNGAHGTTEIATNCDLNYQRTLMLLGLLMRAGEVRRIGQGNLTKYILTPVR